MIFAHQSTRKKIIFSQIVKFEQSYLGVKNKRFTRTLVFVEFLEYED